MAITKVTGGLLGNLAVGTENVALGNTSLDAITSGNYNTAIGSNAATDARQLERASKPASCRRVGAPARPAGWSGAH